jgi:hypothetical protein
MIKSRWVVFIFLCLFISAIGFVPAPDDVALAQEDAVLADNFGLPEGTVFTDEERAYYMAKRVEMAWSWGDLKSVPSFQEAKAAEAAARALATVEETVAVVEPVVETDVAAAKAVFDAVGPTKVATDSEILASLPKIEVTGRKGIWSTIKNVFGRSKTVPKLIAPEITQVGQDLQKDWLGLTTAEVLKNKAAEHGIDLFSEVDVAAAKDEEAALRDYNDLLEMKDEGSLTDEQFYTRLKLFDGRLKELAERESVRMDVAMSARAAAIDAEMAAKDAEAIKGEYETLFEMKDDGSLTEYQFTIRSELLDARLKELAEAESKRVFDRMAAEAKAAVKDAGVDPELGDLSDLLGEDLLSINVETPIVPRLFGESDPEVAEGTGMWATLKRWFGVSDDVPEAEVEAEWKAPQTMEEANENFEEAFKRGFEKQRLYRVQQVAKVAEEAKLMEAADAQAEFDATPSTLRTIRDNWRSFKEWTGKVRTYLSRESFRERRLLWGEDAIDTANRHEYEAAKKSIEGYKMRERARMGLESSDELEVGGDVDVAGEQLKLARAAMRKATAELKIVDLQEAETAKNLAAAEVEIKAKFAEVKAREFADVDAAAEARAKDPSWAWQKTEVMDDSVMESTTDVVSLSVPAFELDEAEAVMTRKAMADYIAGLADMEADIKYRVGKLDYKLEWAVQEREKVTKELTAKMDQEFKKINEITKAKLRATDAAATDAVKIEQMKTDVVADITEDNSLAQIKKMKAYSKSDLLRGILSEEAEVPSIDIEEVSEAETEIIEEVTSDYNAGLVEMEANIQQGLGSGLTQDWADDRRITKTKTLNDDMKLKFKNWLKDNPEEMATEETMIAKVTIEDVVVERGKIANLARPDPNEFWESMGMDDPGFVDRTGDEDIDSVIDEYNDLLDEEADDGLGEGEFAARFKAIEERLMILGEEETTRIIEESAAQMGRTQLDVAMDDYNAFVEVRASLSAEEYITRAKLINYEFSELGYSRPLRIGEELADVDVAEAPEVPEVGFWRRLFNRLFGISEPKSVEADVKSTTDVVSDVTEVASERGAATYAEMAAEVIEDVKLDVPISNVEVLILVDNWFDDGGTKEGWFERWNELKTWGIPSKETIETQMRFGSTVVRVETVPPVGDAGYSDMEVAWDEFKTLREDSSITFDEFLAFQNAAKAAEAARLAETGTVASDVEYFDAEATWNKIITEGKDLETMANEFIAAEDAAAAAVAAEDAARMAETQKAADIFGETTRDVATGDVNIEDIDMKVSNLLDDALDREILELEADSAAYGEDYLGISDGVIDGTMDELSEILSALQEFEFVEI